MKKAVKSALWLSLPLIAVGVGVGGFCWGSGEW